MILLQWISGISAQYTDFMALYISRSGLIFLHGLLAGILIFLLFCCYVYLRMLRKLDRYMLSNGIESIDIADILRVLAEINTTKKRRQ
ncbi:MAG: hypothetical protein K0S47_4159 [Herbinix sp.]|nr:hypothetical protein [Herbinix sp.]